MSKHCVCARLAALAAVVLAAWLSVAPAAAFTIGVSPARIEDEIGGRPKTYSLQVINYGKSATTVQIRVVNFDLDENNQVREIAPRPDSLDQWIIIRPLKVRIAPGKRAVVRFAIRPTSRPKPGEHRAMIFLEQKPEQLKGQKAIRVAYRIGVAVYGQVGKKQIASKLHGLRVVPRGIVVDGEAIGTASSRLNGHFAIWPLGKAPAEAAAIGQVAALSKQSPTKFKPPQGAAAAGPLASLPVFPGTRRNLLTAWPKQLAPGSYTLAVSGRLGERRIAKTLTFKVR